MKKVFEKIHRKKSGEGVTGCLGWGVRVDVKEELKFLGKLKKKNWGGGSGGVRVEGGCGVWEM